MNCKENPEVAVILASYNGEKFIEEQVDSILTGTYSNCRIYVCDDGSSDRTEEIIGGYVARYPGRVFWHRNEQNVGVIKNFLNGVKRINADYYMFCDQDDVWLPEKIEHTLKRMQIEEASYPDLPIAVFGNASMVDGDLKPMGDSFQHMSNLTPEDTSLSHVVMENATIGCTLLFNRSLAALIDKVPDQVRMHDCWVAMIASALGRLVYLDEELLLYRQHGNNTLGGMSDVAYAKKNAGKLKKIKMGLHDSCRQAGALLQCYESSLSEENKKILRDFAEVPGQNWFKRRSTLRRGHYYKTGFLKKLCVFLVI